MNEQNHDAPIYGLGVLMDVERALMDEPSLDGIMKARGISEFSRQVALQISIKHLQEGEMANAYESAQMLEAQYAYPIDRTIEYIKICVAIQMAKQKGLDGDLSKLRALASSMQDAYFPNGFDCDYAFAIEDLRDRVMFGIAKGAATLDGIGWRRFVDDLRMFVDAVSRHEYPLSDLVKVRDYFDRFADVREEDGRDLKARISRVSQAYHRGSAPIVALEAQWLALKYLKPSLRHIKGTEALHDATIHVLHTASAYSWSPTCVEAVASAAESLPESSALVQELFGSVVGPETCGWWWFDEPIPVTTVRPERPNKETVALLWRREIPLGYPPRLWMQTFVMTQAEYGGRVVNHPMPTLSWVWEDGEPLSKLPIFLEENYQRLLNRHVLNGTADELPEISVAIEASMWFSRFMMAGLAWIRQRIVTTEPGVGVRQIARQIQRAQKLKEPPSVRVVHLRRRAASSREPNGDATMIGGGEKRKLGCRFMVQGFWRNQWYPSRQAHSPKWIDPFLKGPDGAPLRERAAVYAVDR